MGSITNIMLGGVGGQGLVLTSKIIGSAAFYNGYDVQTGDVIGLSQRGGKVWGSVRYGERVWSSVVSKGCGDYLVGLEKLETYRWVELLKKEAVVILNNEKIYPNRVLLEKDVYPSSRPEEGAEKQFNWVELDACTMAWEEGNRKAFNMVLIGALSKHLEIEESAWLKSIEENVPKGTVEINIKAFTKGKNYTL